MRPIAIFYHCLFFHGDPPKLRPNACAIISRQMDMVYNSGLLDATSEFIVGINGGAESNAVAQEIIPDKAKLVFHGLKSKAENLTIVELEKWVPSHPGWNVLYFHAKGCTHLPGDAYGDNISAPWRETMNHYLIDEWKTCVADLEAGYESVGCHFMRHLLDGTQNIWAGNFWWATSDFLKEVPSIFLRDRIKVSGISAAVSRYESEVWIGNGRLPKVKEYLPHGGGGIP